ncbi:reverse transcriptase domain-containing protein [Nephila pilipes]|uniref:Reverse transcriptase domain-containing protein n=1 Tax=Nephila pilipes TaxID=299642 RepID=A0A8X6NNR1_NEPPI|nr:reverse transcriptase domain-containing protein [Nephila pilipes]
MSRPPLSPKLSDVILQFCDHEYAFNNNIERAFLNIEVDEDRGYLRLFCFPYENESKSLKTLKMTLVSFGVTLSSFILGTTVKYHIRKYGQERQETFEMPYIAFYVDDLFYGTEKVLRKFFRAFSERCGNS